MNLEIFKDGQSTDFYVEMQRYCAYLDRRHIERHVAITELFRRTVNLPGSVGEFGLFHGSTFFLLARLVEIFNGAQFDKYSSSSCQLFGFELFEGISLDSEDLSGQGVLNKRGGGFSTSHKVFSQILEDFRLISKIPNRIHCIPGDVTATFTSFLEEHAGIRFKFILMDFDLYAPTKFVLNLLPPVLVPEAIIVFDEYGFDEWPGETKAVDEFICKYNLTLKTLPYSHAPGAYTVWKSNFTEE